MAIIPPTTQDLAQIAATYGFRLTAEDLESFRVLVVNGLASYEAVERLYTE